MKLGRFHQYPFERKRYEIDYTQWLKPGEVITNQVVTPPAGLTVDGVSTIAGILYLFASGGVAGASYSVQIAIATNFGQTKVDTIIVSLAT